MNNTKGKPKCVNYVTFLNNVITISSSLGLSLLWFFIGYWIKGGAGFLSRPFFSNLIFLISANPVD